MASIGLEERKDRKSSSYILRPNFRHKFRPAVIKQAMNNILTDELSEKQYDKEEVMDWTKKIADSIIAAIREMGCDRYKFVVQVVIGELRGEGVKMASRCLWDSDTDNCSHEIFMNDTMFCVAATYGVFYY